MSDIRPPRGTSHVNTDEFLANLSAIADHLGYPLEHDARKALSRLIPAEPAAVAGHTVTRARRAMLWAVLAARQAGALTVDAQTLQQAAAESELCFTSSRAGFPRQSWTAPFRNDQQPGDRDDASTKARARDHSLKDDLANN